MKVIHIKPRIRRKLRIGAKAKRTKKEPRLSVFRSNRFIYAQIIDDKEGKTLVSVHIKELKKEKGKKLTKEQQAGILGEILGEKAKKKHIKSVVFDRNGYKYHGRVKALADGARKSGLQF